MRGAASLTHKQAGARTRSLRPDPRSVPLMRCPATEAGGAPASPALPCGQHLCTRDVRGMLLPGCQGARVPGSPQLQGPPEPLGAALLGAQQTINSRLTVYCLQGPERNCRALERLRAQVELIRHLVARREVRQPHKHASAVVGVVPVQVRGAWRCRTRPAPPPPGGLARFVLQHTPGLSAAWKGRSCIIRVRCSCTHGGTKHSCSFCTPCTEHSRVIIHGPCSRSSILHPGHQSGYSREEGLAAAHRQDTCLAAAPSSLPGAPGSAGARLARLTRPTRGERSAPVTCPTKALASPRRSGCTPLTVKAAKAVMVTAGHHSTV